jgi:putative ABC transport system permease protein
MPTLRSLLRAPAFTTIAILSLALGIGANTAIFSLLDQLILKTLPVKNPQELVFFYDPGPSQGSYSSDEFGGPSFSYPMFRALQKEQTPFTAIACAVQTNASFSWRNAATSGLADMVSGNYFDLLGVHAALGRVFTDDDDRTPGDRPIAVLSYSYWTTRFGADPGVLNQTLLINGYPMTIVGVAQKNFAGEKPGRAPDLFIPVTMFAQLTPAWTGFDNRKVFWLPLLARLKSGIPIAQAESAINVSYHAQIEQEVPLLTRPRPTFLARFQAKKLTLKPGQYGRGDLRFDARQPTFLLMGITALVLLIACANIANLQLARAAARSREIAVRLAMGASRAQLIRHLLAESCILSITGGALGLAAAYATLRAIAHALPPSSDFAEAISPTLDIRALLFCLAISVVTGFLFGLFPALQSTRPDLAPTLKDQSGQSTSTGAANAFRKTLVTAQVAISLLLLISAGLFARTLSNLRNIDLGMRVDHLLMFSVSPKLNRYSPEASTHFFDQLTDRLAAIPGVSSVSGGQNPVISGMSNGAGINVPGYTSPDDDSSSSRYDIVGPDYFRTMGIPLIAGREFTRADHALAPKVAIVNETFARHFFAKENPLGRHFAIGGLNSKADIEIVGVIKDAKYADLKAAPPRVFYTPYTQSQVNQSLYFYLRTSIDPSSIAAQIRREVAVLDPNLPVRQMLTLQDQVDEDLFSDRILSALTVIFAALATLLAALGLYGVLAYNIARRTREIGIRMALGADATRVRTLVIREVSWMLAIGTVLGLASAAALGKIIESMLYALNPWDAKTYAAAALILWLIALAAAYIPTRRATSVDPLNALRYE